MLTETAVSNHSGYANFYGDGRMAKNENGGGILSPNVRWKAKESQRASRAVRLIRLSQFLQENVARRKLPATEFGQGPPRVLMKMDIEGSEVEVLLDLIFNGGLNIVNGLMIEFHKRLEKLPERQEAHMKVCGLGMKRILAFVETKSDRCRVFWPIRLAN